MRLRASPLAATFVLAVAGCPRSEEVGPERVAPEPAARAAQDGRERCVESVGPMPERAKQVVRALCADALNLGLVGASIAAATKGEMVLSTGVGRTCAGRALRPSGATPFRVGSITKPFVAALALALQDRGEIDLDAPVARTLSRFARPGDHARRHTTLRHLLTHTSGLLDPPPTPASAALEPSAWLETVRELPHWAPPGELFVYSNTGYQVAGMTLERAGGRPLGELLEGHVLEPMGLRRTTMDPQRALAWGAACGHTIGRDGPVAHDVQQDFDLFAMGARWATPAGGLMASAEDLVRFALATADAQVLGRLCDEAVPTHARPGERYCLGLGWRALPDGTRLFHHAGHTGDFAADLYWVPDRGVAIALLANGGRHLRSTAYAALDALAGVDARIGTSTVTDLDRYAGTYRTTVGDATLTVTRRGSELVLDATALGHTKRALVPTGPRTFVLEADGGRGPTSVTFVPQPGDPDRVRYLRSRAFVAVPADPR